MHCNFIFFKGTQSIPLLTQAGRTASNQNFNIISKRVKQHTILSPFKVITTMLISVLIYYRPDGKLRFQSLDLKGNLHKWFYLYINMAASSEKSVCFTWDHLFKNHIIQFVQLVQLHEHHRTSVIISILPAPIFNGMLQISLPMMKFLHQAWSVGRSVV